jgi:hypothetical protein
MMVSKEPHALSEVPMCEAPIVPYPLIHPSAWKINSANFAFKESPKFGISKKGLDTWATVAIMFT